jgi:type II secretory pathway pseudopilin PulG
MGFRFRKSFKMGPLRLNLSKSGVGASLGVRGARIGVGPRGARLNVGIPGTGIGWEQRASLAAANQRAVTNTPTSGMSPSTAGCFGCLGFVVLAGGIAAILQAATVEPGTASVIGVLGAVALIVWWNVHQKRKRAAAERAAQEAVQMAHQQRFQHLAGRFGEQAAHAIMAGNIWMGATAEMVLEALGPPIDTDEKVYKTKTKHVYKYWPTGANRYAYRVTLENGVVVGWEDNR